VVHGIVWTFVPIGENYSYILWNQSDEYIRTLIDTDAELLKAMGVNVIRVFSDVPPQWVQYLYQRHGIYTVVNDLFGRYGMTVDGRWLGRTDYSDMRTRN
jgi:beta-galactosidase